MLLVVCAWSALMLVPWSPVMPGTGLESSWSLSLHYFFGTQPRLGVDLVNNFGPLGFVHAPLYFPETYHLLVLFWFVVVAIATAAIWVILLKATDHYWWSLLLLLVLIEIGAQSREGLICALILLPLLFRSIEPGLKEDSAFRTWVTPIGLTLSVLLGAVALVKVTYLILGTIILLILTLDDLFRLRRWPINLTVASLVWVLGWCLVGQNATDIPAFIHTSMELAENYSQNLGKRGPKFQPIIGAVSILLLVGSFFIVAAKRMPGVHFLIVLVLIVYFFVIFKAGMTRQDTNHVAITATAYCFVAVLVAAVGWRATSSIIAKSILLATFLVPCYLLATLRASSNIYAPRTPLGFAATQFDLQLQGALDVFRGSPGKQATYARWLQHIRDTHYLPAMKGPVDSLPYNQGNLILQGFHYKPRPLYQSYMVVNPKLNQLNANYWSKDTAPQHIVMFSAQIDGWYVGLGDSMSFPEIVKHYHVSHELKDGLVLRKREKARNYRLDHVQDINAELEEPISVPDCPQRVWMTVNIYPNTKGRLWTALLRSPRVDLVVTSDGKNHRSVLPPGIAAAGFLLSPLGREHANLLNHYRKSESWKALPKAESVKILGNPRYFEKSITVSFACLEFEDA